MGVHAAGFLESGNVLPRRSNAARHHALRCATAPVEQRTAPQPQDDYQPLLSMIYVRSNIPPRRMRSPWSALFVAWIAGLAMGLGAAFVIWTTVTDSTFGIPSEAARSGVSGAPQSSN